MDSTDSDPLRAFLQSQGYRIHHQEEQLKALRAEMLETSFRRKICYLHSALRSTSWWNRFSVSAPCLSMTVLVRQKWQKHQHHLLLSPHLPLISTCPAQSASPVSLANCRAFQGQCDLHFEFQASYFSSERANGIHHLSPLLSSRGLGHSRMEQAASSMQLTPVVHKDLHSNLPDGVTWSGGSQIIPHLTSR